MTSDMLQNRTACLMSDLGWRGALTIFLSDRYHTDRRIWRHVNLDAGTIDWPKMLSGEHFSSGEYLMVRAACALYSSFTPMTTRDGEELNAAEVSLWDLAARLDEDNFTLVLRALAVAAEHPVQWSEDLREL